MGCGHDHTNPAAGAHGTPTDGGGLIAGTADTATQDGAATDPALRDALQTAFGDGAVTFGEVYRSAYSRDGSYFEYLPQAVVRIADADDVTELLGIAHTHAVPVTFRAGGTSLSGQTVGNGIIAELRLGWKRSDVRDDAATVWCEPGVTVDALNATLAAAGRRIGPDPASSRAAMLGGVLSNNSSGMQAGVEHNAYHTLVSIEFILANGHRYDTAVADDRARFARDDAAIADGLAQLRDTVRADPALVARIRRKYAIKNTTGYSLNAFVDFDDPLDICAHLLIGAEGTLAFIVSAVLATLPLDTHQTSALLFFDTVAQAAAAVAPLAASGADAIELMDTPSLRSVAGRPGVPALIDELRDGAAALLIDYQADTADQLDTELATATALIATLDVTDATPFTTTPAQRHALWNVRDGILPTVGGARPPGSSVLLEDVAVAPERLAELIAGEQALFAAYGYDGAVFGHAKAGNTHFVVTDDMRDPARVAHFTRFMDAIIDLVLSLDGSLKAEHGTGRAVAPFVAREWGDDAYAVMRAVKQLFDPSGILNPGVLINDDPAVHVTNIKGMDPVADASIDRCIECGFCEHVCPPDPVTLTPRHRIVVHRVGQELLRAGETGRIAALQHGYASAGGDLGIAADRCATACPLGIDTTPLAAPHALPGKPVGPSSTPAGTDAPQRQAANGEDGDPSGSAG